MKPSSLGADAFDAFYYANCCGRPYERNDIWLESFGRIGQRIVADMAPGRVLDAGCAMGFLVEALRGLHVDAFGIDLSAYAIERVDPSVKPFCRVGSITGDLGGHYDLIVSIEVAEHMSTRDAEAAIANICVHTGDVLFSSSPLDYREPTHVNVHQPEYWAEQFARHGFFRDVDYDASYILPWAARFRKRDEPIHRVIRDYERRYWALLNESTDARAYSTDTQRRVAGAEEQVARLETEAAAERQRAADLAADREREAARASQAEAQCEHLSAEAAAERQRAADLLATVAAERDREASRATQAEAQCGKLSAEVAAERRRGADLTADLAAERRRAADLATDLAADRDRQLTRAALEIDRRSAELERAGHDMRARDLRLNQALDTIACMERSRFWQLRLAWLQFRKRLSPGARR